MYNLMIADGSTDIPNNLEWTQLDIKEIHRASNIQEAKGYLREHPVDILLLDIKRPFVGGLQLLTWVREHYPHIKTIIYTARADFFDVQQAMRFGISDYLIKTTSHGELALAIQRVVQGLKRSKELSLI